MQQGTGGNGENREERRIFGRAPDCHDSPFGDGFPPTPTVGFDQAAPLCSISYFLFNCTVTFQRAYTGVLIAQSGALLCRRMAFGRATLPAAVLGENRSPSWWATPDGFSIRDTAECHSALRHWDQKMTLRNSDRINRMNRISLSLGSGESSSSGFILSKESAGRL